MTEQIGVVFVGQDQQFIASTKQAAAEVAKVSAEEERLAAAAKTLGVDGKKFSQQYARIERQRVAEQTRAARETERDQRTQQKTQAAEATKKKAADDRAERTQRKAAEQSARRKQIADERAKKTAKLEERRAKTAEEQRAKKAAADAKKHQATEQKQRKDRHAAATEAYDDTKKVGLALTASVVAAGLLVAKVAQAALSAAELRNNTRGFLNVLTAGRGDKALENVDRLAGQLGIKFATARDEYQQFRQAGLDNRQSAKLIKLAADLDTVDRSGELARQAISRVLSYTSPNGLQTPEQLVAADRAMALLAKQARVSGKGIESARASTTELAGALNRIDNRKTEALEKLGYRIKPGLDRAANAVADFVEKLSASEGGKQALTDLADAIDSAAAAVVSLSKADPDSTIRKIGDAFQIAKAAAIETKDIFRDVGLAFQEVALAAYEIPYAFYKTAIDMYAIGGYIYKSLANLPSNIKHFVVDPIANAGPQIIDGLVAGLGAGADRAAKAVGELAGKMKTAFKRALGINSPSKVFTGYGEDIGRGVDKGTAKTMPTGEELAAIAQPPANDNGSSWSRVAASGAGAVRAGAIASVGGGLHIDKIEISIQGSGGSLTEDDIKRATYEAMDQWWARKRVSQGAA